MVRNLHCCCTVSSGHTFFGVVPFSFPQGLCQPYHHSIWMLSSTGLTAVTWLLSSLFSWLRKTRLSPLHEYHIWLKSSFPRNKIFNVFVFIVVYRKLHSAKEILLSSCPSLLHVFLLPSFLLFLFPSIFASSPCSLHSLHPRCKGMNCIVYFTCKARVSYQLSVCRKKQPQSYHAFSDICGTVVTHNLKQSSAKFC